MAKPVALTARKGDHHLVDDSLYSIPSAYPPFNFPHIPPLDVSREPSALAKTYFNVTTPGWITDATPYLGFVPAISPTNAPWLRPLRYNYLTIPVQRRDDGRFELRPALCKEWDSLERNFRSLLSAAMSLSDLNLPYPFRLWSFPCQYGYTRAHSTESRARRQALASKEAFLPLMAALSFFAHALVQKRPQEYTKQTVMQQLAATRNISETWSSHVVNSLLDAPLTGGYINCSIDSMIRWISLLRLSGMPLCLSWGTHSKFSAIGRSSLLSGLYPSHEEVAYLRSQPKRPFEYMSPSSPLDQSSFLSARPNLPHPQSSSSSSNPELRGDQGSNQRPGETMKVFFDRRSEENQRMEIEESWSSRRNRLERLEYSKMNLPPGAASHTKVFLWELHEGFRCRLPVEKEHYAQFWTDYGPTQRRYDSFHNEWDICADFDPDGGPKDSGDFLTEEPIDRYPDANPPITPGYTADDYLGRLYGTKISDPLNPVPSHFSLSLRELAYRRFGFSPRSPQNLRSPVFTMKSSREVLGVSKAPVDVGMDDSESGTFLELLDGIKEATFLKDLPPTMDIRDSGNWIHEPWPFEMTYRDIDGGMLLLCGAEKDRLNGVQHFEIGVKSPLAVLELARRRVGSKREDIMEALVEQGSAFHTIIAETADALPNTAITQLPPIRNIVRWEGNPLRPSGCRARLGFRSQDHKFTLTDFLSYVELRDEFLSGPRGRAAILAGGLLARLARKAVHEKDVYNGPVQIVETASIGGLLFERQDKSKTFWDDQLTEEEINLICGVYEVATGPVLGNGTIQTAEMSWFPKPGAWKSSGLNCGYWSRDAEAWYQARLQKIQGGDAKLFINSRWKELVKFNKNARRVTDKADAFARDIPRKSYFIPHFARMEPNNDPSTDIAEQPASVLLYLTGNSSIPVLRPEEAAAAYFQGILDSGVFDGTRARGPRPRTWAELLEMHPSRPQDAATHPNPAAAQTQPTASDVELTNKHPESEAARNKE
ncbi:hypothetical protein V5O48_012550 [Marasmius crinis-equi]|uniref:Uncharacterized protein n=1 Tax=Marasmius crinis-equi TaxID=585013 RepID=A0ABR3F2T7_9AGAR